MTREFINTDSAPAASREGAERGRELTSDRDAAAPPLEDAWGAL